LPFRHVIQRILALARKGAAVADLTIFRYEDKGFSVLEDGLYVSERRLSDRAFRDRLVRFLRASLYGWRYAVDHIDLAVLITLQHATQSGATHQMRMATERKAAFYWIFAPAARRAPSPVKSMKSSRYSAAWF
jgi:hypothetical protein